MQAFFTLLVLSTLSLAIESAEASGSSISGFSFDSASDFELASYGNTDFVPCKDVKTSVVLKSLSLSPNPPSIRKPVKVSSRGKVSVAITKGAKMKIITKLGPLTVDTQTFDMCAEAKKSGKRCPVPPGTHDFNFVVTPRATPLPYLTFDVRAEATNGDGEPLFCFTNKMKFNP